MNDRTDELAERRDRKGTWGDPKHDVVGDLENAATHPDDRDTTEAEGTWAEWLDEEARNTLPKFNLPDGRPAVVYLHCSACNPATLTPLEKCRHWVKCPGGGHAWRPRRGVVYCTHSQCRLVTFGFAADAPDEELHHVASIMLRRKRREQDKALRDGREAVERRDRHRVSRKAKKKRAKAARRTAAKRRK